MRHTFSTNFDARLFGEDVIAPLTHAWRERLPVLVSLSDACEPHELFGLVERIAATAAFVVIAGHEIPIPAIRAVEAASLVVPEDRCAGRARSRHRGRRGCA